jgi:hypothetical protein
MSLGDEIMRPGGPKEIRRWKEGRWRFYHSKSPSISAFALAHCSPCIYVQIFLIRHLYASIHQNDKILAQKVAQSKLKAIYFSSSSKEFAAFYLPACGILSSHLAIIQIVPTPK